MIVLNTVVMLVLAVIYLYLSSSVDKLEKEVEKLNDELNESKMHYKKLNEKIQMIEIIMNHY